jgi:hypothetical protein
MTPRAGITRKGQSLHDPMAEGALSESEMQITVDHVHSNGKGAVVTTHGAYVLLGGTLTARHWLERRVRRMCERLAHDQGYNAFRDLPEARRGLVRRLAEVDAACSLMWADGVVRGRLAERFFEIAGAQRRLALALGLDRVLKDANPLTLRDVRSRYGDGEAKE